MDYDQDKIDEVVLALMYLTLHDEVRAWKSFDFTVLDRLHEKGFIRDPKNKARSVVLTEEGLAKSEALFEKHFTRGS
jgi:uncharacterized protein DUF6429